jgi:homoserine/homoserine lactone efflux protein
MWLGWKQWRSPVALGSVADEAAQASGAKAQLPGTRERFAVGFLTNATNPKGIVFMVAVLPQFIDPLRPLWLQLTLLLLTSVGVEVAVMHGYALLASRAQRWLSSAKARRTQNRVFGGVLMGMGAALLMVKRAVN